MTTLLSRAFCSLSAPFLKKYPLLLLLLLSGGGLTLTGLIGRGSVYQEAEWTGKEPALYLVLDGINRGVSPGQAWTSFSPGKTAVDIALFFGSIFRNEEELALFQTEEGTCRAQGEEGLREAGCGRSTEDGSTVPSSWTKQVRALGTPPEASPTQAMNRCSSSGVITQPRVSPLSRRS